jgi:cadmium resistance transport/sequestration family protein
VLIVGQGEVMIETVLASVVVFVATSVDELVVLTTIFAYAERRKAVAQVYAGQLISQALILTISVLAAFGIETISQKGIGLLGVLPIVLGIRILLGGDDEDQAHETANRLDSSAGFTLTVALIAIGGGGEELAVFIPFLGSLAVPELVMALLTLLLLVPVWCRVSQRIASIKRIQEWIARYQRLFVPVIFIGLGAFVIIDSGILDEIA